MVNVYNHHNAIHKTNACSLNITQASNNNPSLSYFELSVTAIESINIHTTTKTSAKNMWIAGMSGFQSLMTNIFTALYLSNSSPLRPTLGGCSVIPALDTLIQSRSQLWGRLDALQLKIWLQSTWPPLQQLRPRQTVIIDFQFEIVWYLLPNGSSFYIK